MKNPIQTLRVSSGMFASLSGTHRVVKVAGNRHSLDSSESILKANGVQNFLDMRNQIRLYCTEEPLQSTMSLFMLAVDDFAELKVSYGEEAANQAHIFMMKQLSQQRDFLFGTRSNVLISEYIPGRYLVLLPRIAGTDGAVVA